jgi:cytochrome c556
MHKFFSISLTFLSFILPLAGIAAEKTIQLPPESIAQWYKPQNERQVWLHTMFSLRREMQAVTEYAAAADHEGVKRWSKRLADHYRKIGEMVPEWADELELVWAERLEAAAGQGDFDQVIEAARKLGQSCSSCHREFRAVTAALYRAPDFSGIKVANEGGTQDYGTAMEELSQLVNRIKIASEDQRQEVALASLDRLRLRIDDLGATCKECHKDAEPKERILGSLTRGALDELEKGLRADDVKLAGRALGSAAVYACARCHGVHRTLSDITSLVAD